MYFLGIADILILKLTNLLKIPLYLQCLRDKVMNNVVTFRNADILGGENPVLYGVNMEIARGEMAYILGRVGSGKTSMIRTMIGEIPLGSGEAEICGQDLVRLRRRDIPYLRRKIGVVFQDFQLLMDRNVEDNLLFVLRSTGWTDKERMLTKVNNVLLAVGMQTKAHKMPSQLSGGEQQRVAIARAILNEPELILADEPTGNLDSETAEGILTLLRDINQIRGTAIVIVTHNHSICEKYPGRIFICKDEKCTESDKPAL